jgi:hypothetical protein
VHIGVDQPWYQEATGGVDDAGRRGHRDRGARSHCGDPSIRHDDHGVRYRRTAIAIYKRAAGDRQDRRLGIEAGCDDRRQDGEHSRNQHRMPDPAGR